MKPKPHSLIVVALFCFVVSVMEGLAATRNLEMVTKRKFYNADRTKSFEGVLHDFLEYKKIAKISKNGRVSSIKLDKLSKEDQEYVRKMAPFVSIARNIKLDFEEQMSKPVKEVDGELTTITKDFNYMITLKNRSPSQIDGLTVNYKIYYYLGDLEEKGTKIVKKTGSKTLDLYPKLNDYLYTDKLELVKQMENGITVGGGFIGGGG